MCYCLVILSYCFFINNVLYLYHIYYINISYISIEDVFKYLNKIFYQMLFCYSNGWAQWTFITWKRVYLYFLQEFNCTFFLSNSYFDIYILADIFCFHVCFVLLFLMKSIIFKWTYQDDFFNWIVLFVHVYTVHMNLITRTNGLLILNSLFSDFYGSNLVGWILLVNNY